jgi:hypothetical protein
MCSFNVSDPAAPSPGVVTATVAFTSSSGSSLPGTGGSTTGGGGGGGSVTSPGISYSYSSDGAATDSGSTASIYDTLDASGLAAIGSTAAVGALGGRSPDLRLGTNLIR